MGTVFWITSVAACFLAYRFSYRHRDLATLRPRPEWQSLVKGQAKDNWLICAVVWVVFLFQHWRSNDVTLAMCTLAQLWLTRRTMQRLARLDPG